MTYVTRTPSAMLAAATFAVAFAASSPATAYQFHDASGGAACHPANGALGPKFNRTLNYLTNAGTTDAFVICTLQMDDPSATPLPPVGLNVWLFLPTSGTTATCIAQVGGYYQGVNYIKSSVSKTNTSGSPNLSFALQWSAGDMVRSQPYDVVTLNCKLPPGARIGLIEFYGGA